MLTYAGMSTEVIQGNRAMLVPCFTLYCYCTGIGKTWRYVIMAALGTVSAPICPVW